MIKYKHMILCVLYFVIIKYDYNYEIMNKITKKKINEVKISNMYNCYKTLINK